MQQGKCSSSLSAIWQATTSLAGSVDAVTLRMRVLPTVAELEAALASKSPRQSA